MLIIHSRSGLQRLLDPLLVLLLLSTCSLKTRLKTTTILRLGQISKLKLVSLLLVNRLLMASNLLNKLLIIILVSGGGVGIQPIDLIIEKRRLLALLLLLLLVVTNWSIQEGIP